MSTNTSGGGGGGSGGSSFISKTHDSLLQSSLLLNSLTFTHQPLFISFSLSSEQYFETHLIRDAEPYELSLFRTTPSSTSNNRSRYDAVQDPERAGGEERWKATTREGPKRLGGGAVERASPLKERRNKEGESEDPERCLNAVRKLLEVYPLPRAKEHVESLSLLLSGLLTTNHSLEEESKRPLERTGQVGNQNEYARRAAQLEEEMKKEQMEVWALEQLLEEKKIKEARTIKPTPPSNTTTSTRTNRPLPSTLNRGGLTRPIATTTTTTTTTATKPSLPTSSYSPQTTPKKLSRSSLPPPSSISPKIPTTTSTSPSKVTPTTTPRKSGGLPGYMEAQKRTPRNSKTSSELLEEEVELEMPKKMVEVRKSLGGENGLESSRKSLAKGDGGGGGSGLRRKSTLPVGVTEDDLEVIASKIWNGIGDTLRPWARKWLISEGKVVPSPLTELDLEGTLSTLRLILSTKESINSNNGTTPGSPSISSTFNTLTSEQEDALNEPLDLPPNSILELELINLILATLRGVPAIPSPYSTSTTSSTSPSSSPPLPPLTITLRDPPLPSSSTSPSTTPTKGKGKKDPMISMNLLKVYLGHYARERGWGEEGGTTAIYGLVSKTVVRIDRRGREGPMVGFK